MAEHDDPIEPAITPELFQEWRSPRLGTSNPERMNNPVWEWLVKSRLNAYHATQQMNGPSAMDAGPGWCFDRYGQSTTQLPDGRVILIAGEHEDHYDPDFYIYNDVVVLHPDGHIDIFGYPYHVFPPTDFHSATLVGNRIIIIGTLGYMGSRCPGATPVLVLELDTSAVSSVLTRGTPPGWIHSHDAQLTDDKSAIVIRGGKLDRGDPDNSLIENIDDWQLNLTDWRWERLTERHWARFEFRRKDGEPNHLWEIQQALFAHEHPEFPKTEDTLSSYGVPPLHEQLGGPPDFDLLKRLFQPSLSHEKLPDLEDDYRVHRIKVAGVVVRYVQDMYSLQMTVEGDLPEAIIEALTSDFLAKLSGLENSPCEFKHL